MSRLPWPGEIELVTTRLIVSTAADIFAEVVMRIRKLVALSGVLAVGAVAGAQESITPVSPLAPPPASVSPGKLAMTLEAAQRAQHLGMPSLAVGLYREARDVPGADRAALTFSLVTALLDA